MQDKKVNEEALVNIYKNAHIALQSLSNLTPEVVDLDFKQELLDQYEGYEKIIGEISRYMKEHDMEPKDINPLKKAMIWSSIKMNTLADKSKSHMADMMVQGDGYGHRRADAAEKRERKRAERGRPGLCRSAPGPGRRV